jgi:predicted HD superfamily hydrolase involved in NAD metabolism
MDAALTGLADSFSFSGSPQIDAPAFLIHHKCPNTAEHSRQVAETAARLAAQFGINTVQAETAGWLHDISAVVPNAERLKTAQQLGLEILPEEAQVPLLLHQKISAWIAGEYFKIQDNAILAAIACHTTLKAAPTPLETLLFVADKLAWDQKGTPPYAEALTAALARSLDETAWVYQHYLMHSGKLKLAHPWMLASYRELEKRFGGIG